MQRIAKRNKKKKEYFFDDAKRKCQEKIIIPMFWIFDISRVLPGIK